MTTEQLRIRELLAQGKHLHDCPELAALLEQERQWLRARKDAINARLGRIAEEEALIARGLARAGGNVNARIVDCLTAEELRRCDELMLRDQVTEPGQ